MSLYNLGLMQDATSQTTTGGTAIGFEEDGVEVKNGIRLSNMTEDNFILREHVTFRTRTPVLDSSGKYSKAKRFITLVHPKQLADASMVFNLVRIEIEIHPEMTAAEVSDLRLQAAQLLTDSDTQAFISNGSLL